MQRLNAIYVNEPQFGRCFAEGLAEKRDKGLDPDVRGGERGGGGAAIRASSFYLLLWYSDIMDAVLVAWAWKLRLPNLSAAAVLPPGKRVSVRKAALLVPPQELFIRIASHEAFVEQLRGASYAELLIDGARTSLLGAKRKDVTAAKPTAAMWRFPHALMRSIPH